MIWAEGLRPEKHLARQYLFSNTGFVSRASLWLPGAECIDLQLAFDMGLLTAQSHIIAVERDASVFPLMRRRLLRLAEKWGLRHRPLILHRSLHEVVLDRKLDFAFIDLCGTCDRNILRWLEHEFAPKLMTGADVTLTCTYAKRNSSFLQNCRDAFLTQWPALYNSFAGSHDYFDRHNDEREFEPIVVPALLLKCVFRRYDMVMRRPFPYRDTFPMVAFKLSDAQEQETAIYPSFDAINRVIRQRHVAEKQIILSPRSEAALKAVATRRRNREAQL